MPMDDLSPRRQRAFTRMLLQWNEGNRREMPWKGERDPYRIWLSEIILQQTRVEQGMPYYERFLARYPRITDLAAAPDDEVFRLWQGLGYYNRCRHLLRTAREVAANQGRFPDTHAGIRSLPGVGDYTAAAIASFAFGLPHAVVDGNVKRVLARYFGFRDCIDDTAGAGALKRLAQELLDPEAPAVYNQAIMDFGATVCRPRRPACGTCPLRGTCIAHQEGLVELLPLRAPRKAARKRYLHYFVIMHRGRLYLRKRGRGDIWSGLHEFLLWEAGKATDSSAASPVYRELASRNTILATTPSGPYRHQLTHQTLHLRFLLVRTAARPVLDGAWMAVPLKALDTYAFPRPLLSYLREHGWLRDA